MNKFDEIVNLINIMEKYLKVGKMKCDILPVEDILTFVSEEYNAIAHDGNIAKQSYRELLYEYASRNDVSGVCAVLRIILNEHSIIRELYEKKISKYDLGSELIPYKSELQYYKNLERNRLKELPGIQGMDKVPFRGKGVVYSAIMGGYDDIHSPEFINKDLDYVLFTDSDQIETDVWKVIVVDNNVGLDSTRLARMIKIIGGYKYLNNYDYTIWIDGKLQIIGDLMDYIREYSVGSEILCFNHYVSEDIYEEAESCIMLNRDDPEIIKAQINRYRNEGYPEHEGLIDSCMLVRDNRSEIVRKTMYDWWNEVKNGSKRDQLSFNYSCWKNQVLYDSSPLVSFNNKYIRTYDHI